MNEDALRQWAMIYGVAPGETPDVTRRRIYDKLAGRPREPITRETFHRRLDELCALHPRMREAIYEDAALHSAVMQLASAPEWDVARAAAELLLFQCTSKREVFAAYSQHLATAPPRLRFDANHLVQAREEGRAQGRAEVFAAEPPRTAPRFGGELGGVFLGGLGLDAHQVQFRGKRSGDEK